MGAFARGRPNPKLLPNYVPLSPDKHIQLGWDLSTLHSSLDTERYVPISLVELEALSIRAPIVFRRQGRRIIPVIPLGEFGAHPTPYTDARGKWRASPRPGSLQDSPFRLTRVNSKHLMVVDEARLVPIGQTSDPTPVFASEDTLHPDTKSHIDRVVQATKGCWAAETAARKLAQYNLLRTWSENDAALYAVDAAALAKITPNTAAALHASDALRLAYLSVASLGTVRVAEPSVAAAPETSDFLSALREEFK